MADTRRRVNGRCPGCGAVEWFGNHRAIITGPRGTLTCVDLFGVDEIEWMCNRCGHAESGATSLRVALDAAAARAGTLSTR